MEVTRKLRSVLIFILLLTTVSAARPGEGFWHPQERKVELSWKHYFDGLKSTFARENFYQVTFGIATALTFRPLDSAISDRVRRDNENWEVNMPAHLGDNLYLGLSVLGTYLAGEVTKTRHLSNTAIYLGEALVTSQALTFVGKKSVGRTRPNGLNSRSFPSGHSSASFTVASVLDRRYGSRIGIPAYALASWIAFSRVRSGRHYPSDIIAGATLGILVGRGFARDTHERSFYRWLPVVGPGYRGFGLQFWF